jgi:phosphoglucomutase
MTVEEIMEVNPLAGKPAEPEMLVNVPKLVTAYYTERPDPSIPGQRVSFATSGHRGSAFDIAFNECHILAISQAICLYRKQQKIDGPLFLIVGIGWTSCLGRIKKSKPGRIKYLTSLPGS